MTGRYLKGRSIPYQTSLFANDLMLFVCLNAQDHQLIRSVFNMYEGASGVGCNLAKCQLTPIHCNEEQTKLALGSFSCQRADFLVKYLGIPLLVSKLPKLALQPLTDRVADGLPIWKENLMN
jgi:hypothetical protein